MGNKKIIIFDLDGTLANIQHRRHFVTNPNYGWSSGDPIPGSPEAWKPDWDSFHKACVDDAPNVAVIKLLELLIDSQSSDFSTEDFDIEIWSGRDESVRRQTVGWLKKNEIVYKRLRMRPHGDHCPDTVLKKRWLNEVGKENVLMVFDDRDRLVKMWRDEGLTCLQVAEGNF